MNLATPFATKLAGALGLVAVGLGGWFVLVGPETDALSETRTAITDTQDRNLLLGSQLRQLRAQQAGLDRTRAQAARLATAFPSTADQPGMFSQVTAAAEAAGYGPRDVTALTPTAPAVGIGDAESGVQAVAPAEGDVLARQTVSLTAEGSFEQTQLLLEHLEAMPRAYLISSLTLGVGAEPGRFTTTVTGDMFVMAPVEAGGRG